MRRRNQHDEVILHRTTERTPDAFKKGERISRTPSSKGREDCVPVSTLPYRTPRRLLGR